MVSYSPGGKKKKESFDDYYARKVHGLMEFVRDALRSAGKDLEKSPFAGLSFNKSDNTIRDENNRKTVFLIFHAGASFLTDGGDQGSLGQDSPSDMIDAFIDSETFHYYRDTIGLGANGVTVQGKTPLLIDEVMMCSETSNQDGLNWGIQGILVNQIARQLGIPDLFSTGITGVGAFCIMDVAGYSAGNGFIPPYPSAWVRAFMGWDKPKTIPIGTSNSYSVKALCSALDKNSNADDDTTILLVPLNNHEYYLIENRQRNLSGNKSLFRYDTTDNNGIVISPYPYNINIDSNVLSTSDYSGVIQQVSNNDVSLPASGVLVWHVDENIIRERFQYNMVNSDSSYRGVSLVEADGVTDLGIMFRDVFYQAAFDYGGAEDVFPHETLVDRDKKFHVDSISPYTLPSTRSNDGGHTYLKLRIEPSKSNPGKEYLFLTRGSHDHKITNYSDSSFIITTEWDYLVPSWPRCAAPERFYDPLLCELDQSAKGKELILLGKSGRVYAWSGDSSTQNRYNRRPLTVDRVDLRGDTIKDADTAYCLDSLPGVNSMPSVVNGKVFIPSSESRIYVLSGLSATTNNEFDTIPLNIKPSTYICNFRDSSWAIGSRNGRIVFGKSMDTTFSMKLHSDSMVCAIAAIKEKPSVVAAVQVDGSLTICNSEDTKADTRVNVPGIGPYTIVTGDLDRDSVSEIVVSDSRHGIWVYKQDLSLAPGWEAEPADWPSVYTYREGDDSKDRSTLPVNLSPHHWQILTGMGILTFW